MTLSYIARYGLRPLSGASVVYFDSYAHLNCSFRMLALAGESPVITPCALCYGPTPDASHYAFNKWLECLGNLKGTRRDKCHLCFFVKESGCCADLLNWVPDIYRCKCQWYIYWANVTFDLPSIRSINLMRLVDPRSSISCQVCCADTAPKVSLTTLKLLKCGYFRKFQQIVLTYYCPIRLL